MEISASSKALSIIFIISICLANFILIRHQIVRRKSQFYLNPKLMIIFSLAIGDLVFALFVLASNAIMLFEELSFDYYTCRLNVTIATYFHLIHFVYGMGLVTLGAVELCRHRLHSLFFKPGVAIAIGGIPWFLGLVIVLPLCLANIDFNTFDQQHNMQQYSTVYIITTLGPATNISQDTFHLRYCYLQLSLELYYGVSVLFPACFSVVALIIFQIIHDRNRRAQQMTSSQYLISYHKQANPVYQPVRNKKHLDGNDVGAENNLISLDHQENSGSYTTQGPATTISQATNTMSDMMKLLIIAVVFFLMVVPKAAFRVGKSRYIDNIVFFVYLVLGLLMTARSFVTPIIMATLSEFRIDF